MKWIMTRFVFRYIFILVLSAISLLLLGSCASRAVAAQEYRPGVLHATTNGAINPAKAAGVAGACPTGLDSTRTFLVQRQNADLGCSNVGCAYDHIPSVKVRELPGESVGVRVWRDRSDRNVPAALLDSLTEWIAHKTLPRSVDPNKGVVDNVTALFGKPNIGPDGWLNIVLTDIQDDYDSTGLFTAGFVLLQDLPRLQLANCGAIVYLDTHPSASLGAQFMAQTLTHELQHLIRWGHLSVLGGAGAGSATEPFVTEGLSGLAEILLGFTPRTPEYLQHPTSVNVPLLSWGGEYGWGCNPGDPPYAEYCWPATPIQHDHQRAELFMAWVHQTTGKATNIGRAKLGGHRALSEVFADLGSLERAFLMNLQAEVDDWTTGVPVPRKQTWDWPEYRGRYVAPITPSDTSFVLATGAAAAWLSSPAVTTTHRRSVEPIDYRTEAGESGTMLISAAGLYPGQWQPVTLRLQDRTSTEWDHVAEFVSLETYPNPSAGPVTIRTSTEAAVYDLLGRRIAKLSPGRSIWNPPAAGAYVVRAGTVSKIVISQ